MIREMGGDHRGGGWYVVIIAGMNDPQPLDDAQIQEALAGLPQWRYEDHRLVREVIFGDFREAIGFIGQVGFEAEAQNHHPEITNVYNRVTLRLCTHDAGDRVTQRDVELAKAIRGLNWRSNG